jgi:hypothetical protein
MKWHYCITDEYVKVPSIYWWTIRTLNGNKDLVSCGFVIHKDSYIGNGTIMYHQYKILVLFTKKMAHYNEPGPVVGTIHTP